WVFTRAVTADPYFVYACKGGSLVRISPDNGDTKVIATGFWDVQSMVLLKGYLYVIDKGVIKKVHTETGVTTQVGSQLWL
ncbi:hypothetical protein, partial [Dyadobacter sp.]|uniref:hypothetical protein n=1 Tax=Dyadobacter sp. TaxID=1914288 RepID=UPI003F7254AB